jgi:hypothetical protein
MRRAAMRRLRYWVRALGVVQVRCDSDVRKVRYNDKEKVSANPPSSSRLVMVVATRAAVDRAPGAAYTVRRRSSVFPGLSFANKCVKKKGRVR